MDLFQLSTLFTLVHVAAVSTVVVRVIMKRPATGIALSWLLIVAVLPAIGVSLYVLVGERRVGQLRASKIARLRSSFRAIGDIAIKQQMTHVDWTRHSESARAMDHLGRSFGGYATVCHSRLELVSDSQDILLSIIDDINSARKSIWLEIYIWAEGGNADLLLEAVIEAAQRGLRCHLLVDAIGSGAWWKGAQPQRLHEAGVQLLPALPVGIFRTFIGRNDLRLHRKIVVIDGLIAWTGSMNIADPRFFHQSKNVGQWVDAMVRVTGTAVAPLAATVIGDWSLETGESIEELIGPTSLENVQHHGKADVQVIPSGPCESSDGLLQLMLALVNSAKSKLTLTTPYFVPDEALLLAIRGAAGRGVDVAIIVPKQVDSLLTRHASRSYYSDLLDVGVKIYLFRDGLLHTKSIVADDEVTMFGTVNLDMRSLWLNYEVSLFVYDNEFATTLSHLQHGYIENSDLLDAKLWNDRPFLQRMLENTLRLLSPLL